MIYNIMFGRNVKDEPGIYISRMLQMAELVPVDTVIKTVTEDLTFTNQVYNVSAGRYEIVLSGVDRAEVQSYLDKGWVEYTPPEEE